MSNTLQFLYDVTLLRQYFLRTRPLLHLILSSAAFGECLADRGAAFTRADNTVAPQKKPPLDQTEVQSPGGYQSFSIRPLRAFSRRSMPLVGHLPANPFLTGPKA